MFECPMLKNMQSRFITTRVSEFRRRLSMSGRWSVIEHKRRNHRQFPGVRIAHKVEVTAETAAVVG